MVAHKGHVSGQTVSTFVSTSVRFCWTAMLKQLASPTLFQPCWNMLNPSWIDVEWAYSILTFLQQPFNISFVFANVEWSWNCLPHSFDIVGYTIRVRTNRSFHDVSMSVSIAKTAAVAWDWIPGLSWSLLDEKMCWNRFPTPAVNIIQQNRKDVETHLPVCPGLNAMPWNFILLLTINKII